MTFLPIAERELRVAARKRFTYWSRVVAAAFIMLIFGLMLGVLEASSGIGWSAGQVAFTALKWFAFIFAGAAGIFLTSDSISEEKREGTLGLLFLTDLRGHDVVFGKLLSQSLLAFYCLLAAFPILGLPLLMGGVTGVEFGHAMLIICNTLFLSLTLGMFVSSISREVMKAMNGALFLSLLIIVVPPWVDWGRAGWNAAKFHPGVSIISPGYLFMAESGLRPPVFWFDLLLQNSLAWGFLVASCICVPRAWQEKTVLAKGPRQALSGWWRFGSGRARLALRRKLLLRNPILWLASRDRWLPRVVSLVMVIATGIVGWNFYVNWNPTSYSNALSPVLPILMLALILWVGSQSCRMFVDAVRNGAMELILVTPVPPRQIIYGQWTALWRTFLIPTLLFLLLNAANSIENVRMMKRTFAQTSSAALPKNFYHDLELQQIISTAFGMMTLIGDFLAMAWFGMWMGLTSRKTSIAVLKTVCFVCVLPWIAELFVQMFTVMFIAFATAGSNSGRVPFWIGTGLAGLFELVKNILFILWSRNKLLADFRETVVFSGQGSAPRRAALPPVGVVPIPTPPSP